MSRKDELLDYPLITANELKAFIKDVEALKEGSVTGIVNTDRWNRVMAEMTRRQVNAQIQVARSLSRATWVLVLATLGLIAATVWLTLIHR